MQRSTVIASLAAAIALLVLVGGIFVRYMRLADSPADGKARVVDQPVAKRVPQPAASPVRPSTAGDNNGGVFDFSDRVLRMLIASMLADETALRKEATLRFTSDDAYQRFLASLAGNGVRVLGQSEALRAVRLGFDSYRDLAGVMDSLSESDTAAEANYLVRLPPSRGSPESPGAGADAVAFGSGALSWLGISGDNSSWGEGVKVAVLDSGIQDHPAFSGREIREWDMVVDAQGEPVPIDLDAGHGTAVASIIGGSDSRLPGVAPAAELLSFRILDNDGITTSFTLAEAIVAAADAGADVINVSLGSSGDSLLVRDAVAYAHDRGALIVAAAGNEGAQQVSYPAAIEGVVAVAASDARGEHLPFSNAGDSLVEGGMAAPGYGVVSAWPGERVVDFSGTSASAPFVSGAVAATMSQYDGMNAQEAYAHLIEYSNEAGAPLADPQFGSGNLNIGRSMDVGTRGITDAAVASYYYDPVAVAETGGQNMAQVVIENRGTEPLHNLSVEIDGGFGEQTHTVSYLEPGEIEVIHTPVAVGAADDDGKLPVDARVRLNPNLNSSDRDISDNMLEKGLQVTVPEPPVVEITEPSLEGG